MEGSVSQLAATYDPDTVRLLGRAFDDAWEAIAGNYSSPRAAEAARHQLATIILALAPSNRIRDTEFIKYSAMVAMRLTEQISESVKQSRADVAKEQRPLRQNDKARSR
jgi:hypothetical protein